MLQVRLNWIGVHNHEKKINTNISIGEQLKYIERHCRPKWASPTEVFKYARRSVFEGIHRPRLRMGSTAFAPKWNYQGLIPPSNGFNRNEIVGILGNKFLGNGELERKWEEIGKARGRGREEEFPLPICTSYTSFWVLYSSFWSLNILFGSQIILSGCPFPLSQAELWRHSWLI